MTLNKTIGTFVCAILFSGCVYFSTFHNLVPRRHIIFTLCTAVYSVIANQYLRTTSPSLMSSAFSVNPSTSSSKKQLPLSVSPRRKSVRLLFPFTLIFSICGPTIILYVSYINDVRPPHSQIHRIIAPHLFLIMAQIFCETVAFLSAPFFIVYVRFGLTVAFVSYRLAALLTLYSNISAWIRTKEALSLPPFLVAFVQATALLNIVFWAFALLCFLLLYCLPALVVEPQQSQPQQQSEQNQYEFVQLNNRQSKLKTKNT